MFTKADYVEYFELLAEKDRDMVFALQKLILQISDETVLNILQELLGQQMRHHGVVGDLFDRVLKPAIDNRQHKRDRTLGDVKLRNLDTGETLPCRCLDVSLGGLCIELSKDLPQGMYLDAEVRFSDSRRPLYRRAQIMWCCRAGSAQYKAGLRFEGSNV